MRVGLILVLVSVLNVCIYGQFTYPQYRHYTLSDGLPQMQVMSIFQDSRGYIWLGTKGGACYFNGEKFTSLTARDGMINEYVNCFAEDSAGRIWMGTRDGLAIYDGVKISVVKTKGYVHSIAMLPGKLLIAGTQLDSGFYAGVVENDICRYLPGINESTASRVDDITYSYKDSSIVLNSYHGIYSYKNNQLKRIFSSPDTITKIKNSGDDIVFAEGINSRSFRLLEYNEGSIHEIASVKKGRLKVIQQIKSRLRFSVAENAAPIITVTNDTILYDYYKGVQKNVFLTDRNDHLWIGSENGFYKLFNDGFETFKEEYLPVTWSIGEDKNGILWFGTFHFGLIRFDGTRFTRVEPIPGRVSYYHFRTAVDRNGKLYFPGNGLFSYDGRKFGIIDDTTSLTTYYDQRRNLLLAGQHKSVGIFDLKSKKIQIVGAQQGLECRTYIVTINQDRENNYWFGSFSGLASYNPESGKVENYTRKNGRLPADGVISIHKDYKGRMWFGSTNGLLWYDDQTDSVRTLHIEEIDGDMNLITSIDSTWLMFSQQAGIYLMDLQKYYREGKISLSLYNEKNGFRGVEPGQDGAFTDSKGNIWITTGTEVVKINPKDLQPLINSLEIRFTGCNGQPVSFGETKVILGKNVNTATIAFDAICFNRPHSVLYSWKIEGSHDEWSPWKNENYAVLTNLGDGEKIIRLRAKIPGLPLTDYAYASIGLKIQLVFWKQAWFFPALFGFFISIILVSIIILIRTRLRLVTALRQAKVYQVQAIQTQMSPHFIFNALASLQSMILSLNMEKANDYLIRLANLIRGFLDASVSSFALDKENPRKSELPLKQEIEILRNYISFQQEIHPGIFDSEIYVDPDIDTAETLIPPMIVQPFVENSIRHGLLPKSGKGNLHIDIRTDAEAGLIFTISDDGIGIEKADKLKNNSPFRYVSRGRALTIKRIKLLNELGYDIHAETESSDNGTVVTIKLNRNEIRN